ncbi:hypothetical protein A3G14_02280 [Candidatus Curtissbacteria bacterium RIFCSPLOWO2_12_FULL_38_9]|uniref:Rieske domain-containing protein n=2 Tax=Candidatus Curtissiibacteriota TaxID=1752717 RepID=A0A1F5G8G4_9BACT|nr:MAG: hypothetical protein A3D04_01625 [Candidatus Curtissbacteria bacterium RIFCSPHIGHO2_02_FULL_40_16b]OGE14097.1 MAG: hypothetical protein A3G14_02280 [Candidatus Curtissbacteria bacterium RIFCSPLOWO2_12_FULL_38_9]
MAQKVRVAAFNEIPEEGMKAFKVGEKKVAIYKIAGKIYATSNECSHEQCQMDEHHEIHFDIVECTCHGSQFDIKTGQVITPPATEKIATYRTEVNGNDVSVYI